MSYHLDVFSADVPAPPAAAEGPGWQLVVEGPLRVEPEDIPAEVRSSLPGIAFLTRFHLEGDAPASAEKKLIATAQKLARAARGVVVDEQKGTVETPRSVRRLAGDAPPSAAPLQLSWFVHDADRLVRTVPADLIDLFQRTLPECLPRRYGLHEPAQLKLEREGMANFRQFLAEHLRDAPIWDGHKPCRHVIISIPDRVGPTPHGFRCARLTLNFDGHVSADRAWRVELTRLWIAVAELIRPFYAEIRLGESPTKSWWWNGIPAQGASAILIGDPYTGLWPAFASAARLTPAGLRYAEHFVDDVSRAPLPAPPVSIAQPPEPAISKTFDPTKPGGLAAMLERSIPYPEVWPF